MFKSDLFKICLFLIANISVASNLYAELNSRIVSLIQRGHHGIATQELQKLSPEDLRATDDEGNGYLHIAASVSGFTERHREIVNTLLTLGLDPEEENDGRQTPMSLALIHENGQFVDAVTDYSSRSSSVASSSASNPESSDDDSFLSRVRDVVGNLAAALDMANEIVSGSASMPVFRPVSPLKYDSSEDELLGKRSKRSRFATRRNANKKERSVREEPYSKASLSNTRNCKSPFLGNVMHGYCGQERRFRRVISPTLLKGTLGEEARSRIYAENPNLYPFKPHYNEISHRDTAYTRTFPNSALTNGHRERYTPITEMLVFLDEEIVLDAPIYRAAEQDISYGRDASEQFRIRFSVHNGAHVLGQYQPRGSSAAALAMLLMDQGASMSSELINILRSSDSFNNNAWLSAMSARMGFTTDIVTVSDEGEVLLENKEREYVMHYLHRDVTANGPVMISINDPEVGGMHIIVDRFVHLQDGTIAVVIRDPFHGWQIVVKASALESRILRDNDPQSIIRLRRNY